MRYQGRRDSMEIEILEVDIPFSWPFWPFLPLWKSNLDFKELKEAVLSNRISAEEAQRLTEVQTEQAVLFDGTYYFYCCKEHKKLWEDLVKRGERKIIFYVDHNHLMELYPTEKELHTKCPKEPFRSREALEKAGWRYR